MSTVHTSVCDHDHERSTRTTITRAAVEVEQDYWYC